MSGTLNVVGTLTLEAGAEVNVGSDGDIAGAGTVTATSGAKIIVTKTLTAGNLSTINDAGTWTYNGSTWSKG